MCMFLFGLSSLFKGGILVRTKTRGLGSSLVIGLWIRYPEGVQFSHQEDGLDWGNLFLPAVRVYDSRIPSLLDGMDIFYTQIQWLGGGRVFVGGMINAP